MVDDRQTTVTDAGASWPQSSVKHRFRHIQKVTLYTNIDSGVKDRKNITDYSRYYWLRLWYRGWGLRAIRTTSLQTVMGRS